MVCPTASSATATPAAFLPVKLSPDRAGTVEEVFKKSGKHVEIDRSAQYDNVCGQHFGVEFLHIIGDGAHALAFFAAGLAGEAAQAALDILLPEKYQLYLSSVLLQVIQQLSKHPLGVALARRTADSYNVHLFLKSLSASGCHRHIHRDVVQNGPCQYHDVKDFMETKRAGYGVRPLQGVNNRSDAVGYSAAQYQEK